MKVVLGVGERYNPRQYNSDVCAVSPVTEFETSVNTYS